MRYIFVISSRAGSCRHKAMGQLLSRYFPEGVTSLLVDPPDSLIDELYRTHRSEELRLVAVGGDGTVQRLLTAAVRYQVPIGIVPHGTANDLARTIGLKRKLEECCYVIQAGHTRPIDLIAVNGKLFATCGGLGFPSYVAIRHNRDYLVKGDSRVHPAGLRKATYLVAALRELGRSHSVEVRIEVCGRLWSGRAMAVVFSNQARFGVVFSLSPEAIDNDGVFDLCAIPNPGSPLREARIVLEAALGRGAVLPGAVYSRLSYAHIFTDRVVPFFGDGEILTRDRDFEIVILPQAVLLIVPEKAFGEEVGLCA